MFRAKNELVYCSKDRNDWEKAKTLLAEAGVKSRSWESEETPVGGCGCKIDPRTFMTGKKAIPRTIFRIQVPVPEADSARKTLEGRVRPVQHYGI